MAMRRGKIEGGNFYGEFLGQHRKNPDSRGDRGGVLSGMVGKRRLRSPRRFRPSPVIMQRAHLLADFDRGDKTRGFDGEHGTGQLV